MPRKFRREADWTPQQEADYQRNLEDRREKRRRGEPDVTQGEAQRILGPEGVERRAEEDRRQQERRQNVPIPCKKCGQGQLVGQNCNNCGASVQEILAMPTSRDEPTGYQPSVYAARSPADPDEENKIMEDFDTEDSVLDALGDAGAVIVPKGKKKKQAIVSNPPDAQSTAGEGGPSYPPNSIVPPAQPGPSTPPQGQIPQHEVAQPFVGYEGVETGNAAVDQQVQMEINNRGISPEMARQKALQLQQDALRKQHQEGWNPQNMYQLASFESSIRESLEHYAHGFVSQVQVDKAKKLLS